MDQREMLGEYEGTSAVCVATEAAFAKRKRDDLLLLLLTFLLKFTTLAFNAIYEMTLPVLAYNNKYNSNTTIYNNNNITTSISWAIVIPRDSNFWPKLPAWLFCVWAFMLNVYTFERQSV